ncbi:MAG: hypothetical protein COB93_04635 [Sneathiella sp.]|nr:MAG: hypothetical protein COB93_04635 [Sneathiella sp.]
MKQLYLLCFNKLGCIGNVFQIQFPLKTVCGALFCVLLAVFCTPAYADGKVRTKEFLEFEYSSQDYFIKVTINAATVIATQIRRDLALCIADWYTDDPKTVKQRNGEILKIMKGVPESYPSAVLIAILQKKCGKFTP